MITAEEKTEFKKTQPKHHGPRRLAVGPFLQELPLQCLEELDERGQLV